MPPLLFGKQQTYEWRAMYRKKKQETRKSFTRIWVSMTSQSTLVTPHGGWYFQIKPTNISVLSDSSIGARIYALMNVLKGISDISTVPKQPGKLRGQQRLLKPGYRSRILSSETVGTGYVFP